MKRILLSLLTFGLCLHMMANNDVHLKRFVKCVNDSNYIRATKELPKVKDWSYEKFDKIPYVEIENALTYADYLTSINVSKALQDSFLLYVEKYATQFAYGCDLFIFIYRYAYKTYFQKIIRKLSSILFDI